MAELSNSFSKLQQSLLSDRKRWLVTGVAGFIGSNILEHLLNLGQEVVGLDNFITGHKSNLEDVKERVGSKFDQQFEFIEGDISNFKNCKTAAAGAEYVLHQAALGSVPRSIDDPIASNESNVSGYLNMLVAARDAGAKRFVYASSSSVYGDEKTLPKVEQRIGNQLSPYAVTKYVNELYAGVFGSAYGMEIIGLRYFNVFGPRQDPNGAYAAVIPKWIGRILKGEECVIYGDGETSRDFCYVDNAVQANLLAAVSENPDAVGQCYNVAVSEQTSLNQLYKTIAQELKNSNQALEIKELSYQDFRAGDIRHSLADITKATNLLGYTPDVRVGEGLKKTVGWFLDSKHAKT